MQNGKYGLIDLNGKKILLRGNHDFERGVNVWKEVGMYSGK